MPTLNKIKCRIKSDKNKISKTFIIILQLYHMDSQIKLIGSESSNQHEMSQVSSFSRSHYYLSSQSSPSHSFFSNNFNNQHPQSSQNFFSNVKNSTEHTLIQPINSYEGQIQEEIKRKGQKDSSQQNNKNCLKKLGRIIIDHYQAYEDGKNNEGYKKMWELLEGKVKTKKENPKITKKHNQKEYFNTYALRKLFQCSETTTVVSNLRTTQRLLNRHLRRSILNTPQTMLDKNKVLYLNTLKASSLRMGNPNLARRLCGVKKVKNVGKKEKRMQERMVNQHEEKEDEDNAPLIKEYKWLKKSRK